MNLDFLPAWARHLVIIFGSTLGGGFVQAIFDAHGVTGIDYPATLRVSVDAAAVATASGAAVLWGLPITRQYGVGAIGEQPPPADLTNQDPAPISPVIPIVPPVTPPVAPTQDIPAPPDGTQDPA